MTQVPRNMFIGALVALAVFLYVFAGYLAQVFHGTPVGVPFFDVLGMAVGFGLVVGAVVWGLVSWIARSSKLDPKAKIRLGGIPAVASAVVLATVTVVGAMVGVGRNAESDKAVAAAAAAKSARERSMAAEAARVAALTPEQVAAEKRAKELLVENAKKAQEAVAAASAAAELQKSLLMVKQALVLQSLKSLRESMKDPDTFELKQVLMMESGSGCITYRARNSFGAALQSHAVLSVPPEPKKGAKATGKIRMYAEGNDGFSAAWNRSCANQQGDDFTRTAKGVLRWD